MTTLRVSEIFYSLQGEGSRAGSPSLFVRLSGCSAKYACYASGVRCDTEFESGRTMTLAELAFELDALRKKSQDPCQWIVWTGGEPFDQLNEEVLEYFAVQHGYQNAIETSGIHAVPRSKHIHWLVISPKVAEHVLVKNFAEWDIVHELRYVRHAGQSIPEPSLRAIMRFISPHFDGQNINSAAVAHCVALVLDNPSWHLSLQLHKLLGIL